MRSGRVEQVQAVRGGGGLAAGGNARGGRARRSGCDVTVAAPGRDQTQHLQLAPGQPIGAATENWRQLISTRAHRAARLIAAAAAGRGARRQPADRCSREAAAARAAARRRRPRRADRVGQSAALADDSRAAAATADAVRCGRRWPGGPAPTAAAWACAIRHVLETPAAVAPSALGTPAGPPNSRHRAGGLEPARPRWQQRPR